MIGTLSSCLHFRVMNLFLWLNRGPELLKELENQDGGGNW